jgi:hypothetical protein
MFVATLTHTQTQAHTLYHTLLSLICVLCLALSAFLCDAFHNTSKSTAKYSCLVCSVAALLVANQSIQPGMALTPPSQPTININSMTNADVQIQRIEHEKAQTLAELEPALRRQAELQVKVFSIAEPR